MIARRPTYKRSFWVEGVAEIMKNVPKSTDELGLFDEYLRQIGAETLDLRTYDAEFDRFDLWLQFEKRRSRGDALLILLILRKQLLAIGE